MQLLCAKKATFLSFVFAFLSADVTLAQEECVEIESDLERLVCYDNAFTGSGEESSLTPAEAFSKFSDLVASEYSGQETSNGQRTNALYVGSAFQEETCNVLLISASNKIHMLGQNPDGHIRIALFNAGGVNSVSRASGTGVDTRIMMDRNQIVSSYVYIGRHIGDAGYLEGAYRDVLNNFPDRGFDGSRAKYINESASLSVNMITSESEVDQPEIYSALMDVAEACS